MPRALLPLLALLALAACVPPPPADNQARFGLGGSPEPAVEAACADDPAPGETGPIIRNAVLSLSDTGTGTLLEASACMRFVPVRTADTSYAARVTVLFFDNRGNRLASETRQFSFPADTGLAADGGGELRNLRLPFVELAAQGNTPYRIDHAVVSRRLVFEVAYAGCSAPGACDYGRTVTVNRVATACVVDAARPGQLAGNCAGRGVVVPAAAAAPPPIAAPRGRRR